MATNAERQKEYRKRMRERGLVPVTAYVPADQVGSITLQLSRLCDEGVTLELGPLRNYVTGKLMSAR
jgi:hypothetical protein